MITNGASMSVIDMGTISLTINGIPVKLINCYHTLDLRGSHIHGCSFIGDQHGMYLTFGQVFNRVQDDIDCRIQLRPLPYHPSIKYSLGHMVPPPSACVLVPLDPPSQLHTKFPTPIPASSLLRPVT
jgi:hypothetical protein